jgi:hypothetical protein
MTAPGNAQLTFDEPDGGYSYGAPVTATLTATSENASTVTRTLDGTVTDPGTGETSPVTGSFDVTGVPNPLQASVSETDAPIQWSAGTSSQAGTVFTATFTATAA